MAATMACKLALQESCNAGPISKWDEAKLKKWRVEETKDFTGKMGYVKLGAKGRRGGGERRHGYY